MLANYYWCWDSVVDKSFCKYVIDSLDWNKSQKGTYSKNFIAGAGNDPKVRDTDIIFCDNNHPMSGTLMNFTLRANKSAGWNYAIDYFQDAQIGRYGKDSHYDWHRDTAVPNEDNQQRKLTAVMLLNDSSEFEGGCLQIEAVDKENLLTKAGDVIVFPSFLSHRVTPVVSGTRYTAVCWAVGPLFR